MLVDAKLVLGNLDECDVDAMSAVLVAVSETLPPEAVVLSDLTTSNDDKRDGWDCPFDTVRLIGCVTTELDEDDTDASVVAADGRAVNSHEVIGGKPSPGRRDSSLTPI